MVETLIEDFVEHIETAVEAVATQVPYTKKIVNIAFVSVENVGIYYDGVKECRCKDITDKTWDAFKIFFAREFREICVQPRTSESNDKERTARESDIPMPRCWKKRNSSKHNLSRIWQHRWYQTGKQ